MSQGLIAGEEGEGFSCIRLGTLITPMEYIPPFSTPVEISINQTHLNQCTLVLSLTQMGFPDVVTCDASKSVKEVTC
jgi:hypothetical protein